VYAGPPVAVPYGALKAFTATGATPAEPRDEQPRPPFLQAQASQPNNALPSLVLPPSATADPPMFASLMRMGDTAMVRGDILRARALYERAASIQPGSPAAPVAAGKTYDPHVLSRLGLNSAGVADSNKAKEWYERARALGDPAAASLIAPLR